MLSAVSFVEPLLEALGLDLLPSLWLGDALDVAAAGHPPFSAAAPALLTQLYSRSVASEVKLTLMSAYPDEHLVALVHGAGDDVSGDASASAPPIDDSHAAGCAAVEWMPLHAIDRSDGIGSRTSLYVPPWRAEQEAGHAAASGGEPAFESVLSGVARARDALEGPWQEGDPTHAQQAPRLLAAAAAAAAAADAQDAPALQGALRCALRCVQAACVCAVLTIATRWLAKRQLRWRMCCWRSPRTRRSARTTATSRRATFWRRQQRRRRR